MFARSPFLTDEHEMIRECQNILSAFQDKAVVILMMAEL